MTLRKQPDPDTPDASATGAPGRKTGDARGDRDAVLKRLDRLELLSTAIECTDEAIVLTDAEGKIQYVNPAFARNTGYTAAEALGENPRILKSGTHDAAFYKGLWDTITSGQVWSGQIRNHRKDGSLLIEAATIAPVRNPAGDITHYVAVKRDVTNQAGLEARLLRAQKLEGIGQLAAGIAHEINTPTQYVSDNTSFLQQAFERLMKVVDAAETLVEASARASLDKATIKAAQRTFRRARLDYLRQEVPKSLKQSLEGLRRVSHIVNAMKDFSHPSEGVRSANDLRQLIDNTVTVSRNEWKYVAEVVIEVDDDLPPLPCYRDELGQAILNLIVNAAHAIKATERQEKGTIRLSARREGGQVELRVADDGIGIPAEIMERVFEPFFTTKPPGKGTGQGLAITHDVIVTKHGGTIDLASEVGEGSVFILRLPLDA